MRIRTTIIINDRITQRDAARLAAFVVQLQPVVVGAVVDTDADYVTVQWATTQGTVVEAAAMWFPMLLGCWLHIDRTLESRDITEVRIEEVP